MIVLELGAIPAEPLSLNKANKLHWAERRRLTDPWKQLAWATALQSGLAQALAQAPCTVTVHIPFQTRHRRDPHNYVPVCKAVVDGLVRAKVWPDDNPAWVTVTEPTLVYDPTGRTPASVVLTPREDM